MSYSSKIFKKAYEKLQEKRDKNKQILELRKEEIYNKIPEYLTLKKEVIKLLGECVKNMGVYSPEKNEEIKKTIKEAEQKKTELLVKNGYPKDYLDDIFECNECKDTGYIASKKCSCLEKILKEIASDESNLSYVLDKKNFENFDLNMFSDKPDDSGISPKDNMKNILNHTKNFIDNFDNAGTKSLLFTGSTGVGKTYLSGCIAKTLIDNGKNVLYQSCIKLSEVLDEYKFNRENAMYDTKSIIKDLYEIDLLIIDDLGTEFKTSYTLTALFELINSRLINNKKMIISTNLSVLELKEVYSERLFSRFIGEFLILEFTGEDLRIKNIFAK
ncbi:MAG: ATP-binding protein [Clostridia bacterium]|nr:ATP-binding protein [Clostridia bacterium]